jgi:hypothetical protein
MSCAGGIFTTNAANGAACRCAWGCTAASQCGGQTHRKHVLVVNHATEAHQQLVGLGLVDAEHVAPSAAGACRQDTPWRSLQDDTGPFTGIRWVVGAIHTITALIHGHVCPPQCTGMKYYISTNICYISANTCN